MLKRGALVVLIIILLTGGYFVVTLKGLNYAGIYDKHLSAIKPFKDKHEQFAVDLEFLYKEIKENYVNLPYKENRFNFSWDELYKEAVDELKDVETEAEFYELASKLFYNLRDGHTYFSYIHKSPYQFNNTLKGLFRVRYIENKPIIVAAQPLYTTEDNSVLGKEIVSIDNVGFNTIVDFISENYGRYSEELLARSEIVATNRFWEFFYKDSYQLPEVLEIKLKDLNGEITSWELETNKVYERIPLNVMQGVNYGFISNTLPSYQIVNGNIGYIKIPTFNESRKLINNRFNEIIDKFKELNVEAVILDIRNNGGGNGSYRDVLGYLTEEPIDIANYRMRKSERQKDIYYLRELYENIRSKSPNVEADEGYTKWFTWSVKPNKEQYLANVPVALIVNERIFSSADAFAKTCLDYDLATVIGNYVPLSGHGMPTSIALPSGKYAVTYGFFEIRGIDFEHLESTSVLPDIISQLKLPDIMQNKDTQIQDAIKYLSEKLK